MSSFLEGILASGGLRMAGFDLTVLRRQTTLDLRSKEQHLSKILSQTEIEDYRYYRLYSDAQEAIYRVMTVLYERAKDRAEKNSMVKRVLTISTSHIPSDLPDWGDREVMHFASGWTVFAHPSNLKDTPQWLIPIDEMAEELNCELIRFDCDGSTFSQLPTYNWDETSELVSAGALDALHVANGDPIDQVVQRLQRTDKGLLAEVLSNIAESIGYEDGKYDEQHEMPGADLISRIQTLFAKKLKITFP